MMADELKRIQKEVSWPKQGTVTELAWMDLRKTMRTFRWDSWRPS